MTQLKNSSKNQEEEKKMKLLKTATLFLCALCQKLWEAKPEGGGRRRKNLQFILLSDPVSPPPPPIPPNRALQTILGSFNPLLPPF